MDHSARPICAISTVTTDHAVPEHASSRPEGFEVDILAKLYIHPILSQHQGKACGRWPWRCACVVDMCEGVNLNHEPRK